MTLAELGLLLAGMYVANTLAFVSAYWLTEWSTDWRNDRRWKRERAAMTDAHAKGTPPRGGKR